jgi:hypothetical protein
LLSYFDHTIGVALALELLCDTLITTCQDAGFHENRQRGIGGQRLVVWT